MEITITREAILLHQASSYALVAEPQWFGPIGVLQGTTGGYAKRLA